MSKCYRERDVCKYGQYFEQLLPFAAAYLAVRRQKGRKHVQFQANYVINMLLTVATFPYISPLPTNPNESVTLLLNSRPAEASN